MKKYSFSVNRSHGPHSTNHRLARIENKPITSWWIKFSCPSSGHRNLWIRLTIFTKRRRSYPFNNMSGGPLSYYRLSIAFASFHNRSQSTANKSFTSKWRLKSQIFLNSEEAIAVWTESVINEENFAFHNFVVRNNSRCAHTQYICVCKQVGYCCNCFWLSNKCVIWILLSHSTVFTYIELEL